MKFREQHGCRHPVLQVAVLLAFFAAFVGCGPVKRDSPVVSKNQGRDGYEMYCAMCHLDGGAYFPNPALKGSAVLAGPPSNTIQIILHGQAGKSKIDGQIAGGIMPAQAGLADEEIAAIVNYVRSEFAGKDDAVSAEDVQALRIK